MNVIKQRVEEGISDSCSVEVAKITSDVVKLAAASMKKGKGDVSGRYASDAIRIAPDILYDNLALVKKAH